jgi:hypothetical protein
MRFQNTKEVVATIGGFTTSLHHMSLMEVLVSPNIEPTSIEMLQTSELNTT